jgi:hypothetical protein
MKSVAFLRSAATLITRIETECQLTYRWSASWLRAFMRSRTSPHLPDAISVFL